MPLQNFVNFSTPAIGATWLNQVDAFMTTLFAGATTAAAARTAISAAASGANSDITSLGALTGTLYDGGFAATQVITGSSNRGAYSYQALSYYDTNILYSGLTSVNSYAQAVFQNTSSGTTASTDIIVSNDQGTATTYYGNLGINSSGFSGSGSLNLPSATYLSSTSGDLVLGTTTSNQIRLVTNSAAKDAATVDITNILNINGSVKLNGSTSGTLTLAPNATTTSYQLTLPAAAPVANGQVLAYTTAGVASWLTVGGSGTVTSVAMTVPSFLSITGSPVTTSGTLAVTLSGTALPVANGGTGATASTGSGAVVLAVGPTLSGSTSIPSVYLTNAVELTNIIAAAPTSTQNLYLNLGATTLFTTNAANNWTFNVAMSSGTSLNTALSTGQTVTIEATTTQGGTAYYCTALTIDGNSQTVKWIGGAPSAGNASGLDVYLFTITKTASATYTVLGSQTQYK